MALPFLEEETQMAPAAPAVAAERRAEQRAEAAQRRAEAAEMRAAELESWVVEWMGEAQGAFDREDEAEGRASRAERLARQADRRRNAEGWAAAGARAAAAAVVAQLGPIDVE